MANKTVTIEMVIAGTPGSVTQAAARAAAASLPRTAPTRAQSRHPRLSRFAHNVIAHPLLVLCPPLGEWLHDRTEP